MTKKDFELIAETLSEYVGYATATEEDSVFMRHLCEDMADNLQSENPRFDRQRFLAACGLED